MRCLVPLCEDALAYSYLLFTFLTFSYKDRYCSLKNLSPCCSVLEKRASPGIEPGPPAPKAGILPLNYKAFLLLYQAARYYLRGPLAAA